MQTESSKLENLATPGSTAIQTVYVIDDDDSMRRSLSRLLTASGIPTLSFSSADEYLEHSPHGASGCVLLDLSMPGCDGLELQDRLSRIGRTLPIVFLTGCGDVPSSVRAMKLGAVDFLTKPVEKKRLLPAIRAAFAQDESLRSRQALQDDVRERLERLTPREREVIQLVAQGLLNKQIAAELGTVEKTVKVHRSRAMAKMQLTSVAELVRLLGRTEPAFA